MTFHWPPRLLGLGPPLNLVSFLPEHRAGLGRRTLASIVFAVAAAIVIAAIDQVFFEGVTARRTPSLDMHPTPPAREAVTFIGGLLEELFRAFFATAVAAAEWSAIRSGVGERTSNVSVAEWTGAIVAPIVVGVWHVCMVSDPSLMTCGYLRLMPSVICYTGGPTGGAAWR